MRPWIPSDKATALFGGYPYRDGCSDEVFGTQSDAWPHEGRCPWARPLILQPGTSHPDRLLLGVAFGLFGRAGGLAVAPALLAVLPYCGVATAAAPRLAVTTALAILIPVTISQADGNLNWKAIDWDLVILLAPSAAVGAVTATTFADALDGRIVALLVATGTLLLALRLVRGPGGISRTRQGRRSSAHRHDAQDNRGRRLGRPHRCERGFGLAPLLAKALPSEKAAATASALTFPFALVASAGTVLSPAPACGPACAGVIFLPGLAAVGMTAVLIAPLAMRLRPFLPLGTASRLLALLVIAIVCIAGLRSQGIVSLLAETPESALDLVLGPLCNSKPAPAAPGFESEKTLPQTSISEPQQ